MARNQTGIIPLSSKLQKQRLLIHRDAIGIAGRIRWHPKEVEQRIENKSPASKGFHLKVKP